MVRAGFVYFWKLSHRHLMYACILHCVWLYRYVLANYHHDQMKKLCTRWPLLVSLQVVRLAVLFLVMVLFVFPSRSQELLKWTEYDLQIWYSPAMARIVVWFESAIWDLLKFPDSKHILICNENSQFSNFLQILSLVCWKRKWYYDLLPRILNLWRV